MLIVETGNGLPTGESYVSVANADTYLSALFTSSQLDEWNSLSVEDKEIYLRRAAQFIDNQFTFTGYKSTISQSLEWPRYEVYDDNSGRLFVASNEIPRDLQFANAELAANFAIGNDPTNLTATSSEDDAVVTSERIKIGPIEEEIKYGGSGKSDISYSISSFPTVISRLKKFTQSQGRVYRS